MCTLLSFFWSPVGFSERAFIYTDKGCSQEITLILFSPLQCCLESVEGWAGSVSPKHSCISPTKSNWIMGAGLSLEFLESVPK